MPKLKTHRGAKKRFKASSGGKVKVKSSGGSHLLSKKSRKQKRHKGIRILNTTDGKLIKKLVPTI